MASDPDGRHVDEDLAFVRQAQSLITSAVAPLETRLCVLAALEFVEDVLAGRGADPPTPIAPGVLDRFRRRRAVIASKLRLRAICAQE